MTKLPYGDDVVRCTWRSLEIGEIRGVPKIRGTFWGVPTTRIIVFLGLYWGPSI